MCTLGPPGGVSEVVMGRRLQKAYIGTGGLGVGVDPLTPSGELSFEPPRGHNYFKVKPRKTSILPYPFAFMTPVNHNVPRSGA